VSSSRGPGDKPLLSAKEKTPEGDTGVFGADDQCGGSIAPHSKQHRGATVHITCPFFHNLSDQPAAIGPIRLGSLFLTLPTRALTGQEAAYRRCDLFEKRRQLAEAWARYCAGQGETEDNVIPLRAQG
jgi:hypothetical protein